MLTSLASEGRAVAATLRFVHGREIVVRDYWHAGDRVMFSQPRGSVGVPRGMIATIDGHPMRELPAPRASTATKIGGTPEAVNAADLSGHARSVTLGAVMASKDELYDRAVDCVADGDLDGAIAAYREALALDPGFTDALHGLAMAYADKGMFDEAIEHGTRLVELTPEDTLAHTSLSMFYQRAGKIPEAEAEGAKARMLDWKRQLAEQETGGADKKRDGGS